MPLMRIYNWELVLLEQLGKTEGLLFNKNVIIGYKNTASVIMSIFIYLTLSINS